MGYLIKAVITEIITAKVTLTKGNLLTPGFIYNIPEYTAIPGYFWNVLYMNGQIINGTTIYTGTSSIHIQSASATTMQLRFAGTYMQNVPNTWDIAIPGGVVATRFSPNSQLQIHNSGTLTGGNTELNLYIGANLIPY